MASARSTAGFVAPVVGLILIAWLVQLAGLYFVHRCRATPTASCKQPACSTMPSCTTLLASSGCLSACLLAMTCGLHLHDGACCQSRSCKERPSFSPWWAATTTAQLPGGASCAKVQGFACVIKCLMQHMQEGSKGTVLTKFSLCHC